MSRGFLEADGRPIWVADCETDPFSHGVVPHPFIWGIYHGYDGGFYREFLGSGPAFACTRDDLRAMVDYLAGQEIIIYAHNGGKFDWHFLSPFLEPDSDILIIHGRLARFKIGKCEFRDSYNLLPVALEQYQKMQFDYTKMQKEHRHDHLEEIRAYLKSDCVNLWNMVYGFVESYGLHITQASAAMSFWRKKMGNKVYRSGPSYYDKFKSYYYGGRVQCFEQGDFDVDAVSIDIKSAYPDGMLSPHPYGLEFEEREGQPRCDLTKWGPMFFTVECIAHGCFPYRGNNGALYFPDDCEPRIYDVTGWELLAAVDTGTLEQLKFLYHYRFAEVKDFAEYVLYFWNLRKAFREKGDDGAVFYCKIFMNALYGKFATDPRKYRYYTLRRGDELDSIIQSLGPGDSFQQFREWLIVSQDKAGAKKNQFYNIATAASITGFVRAKLWKAIKGCESVPGERVLYCDTDSITTTAVGPAIVIGEELGQWGIEHSYDRAVIAGKKLYAFRKSTDCYAAEVAKWAKRPPDKRGKKPQRWKLASKGARLSHKEIVRIAAGELITFKNEAPTFSASKSQPHFITRELGLTASDIRHVPRRFDPKFY